jgi:hypothetical protein
MATAEAVSGTQRGGGALVATMRPRLGRAALVVCASAALLMPAQAVIAQAARPASVPIHDPCEPRQLPDLGGFDRLLQDGALVRLDRAAGQFGSSREEQPGDVGSLLTACCGRERSVQVQPCDRTRVSISRAVTGSRQCEQAR